MLAQENQRPSFKEPSLEEAAAELLSRRRAEASLHEFMRQAWPQVESGRSFVDSWHIGAIAEHLEAVYAGQIRRLIINQPPRTGKSTLSAVMFPAWCWLKAPATQFVYASYSQDLSIRDSRKCRALIEGNWYQTRWASKFGLVSDQNAKTRYDNDHHGYRIATSVGGMLTGEGADVLVVDDPQATDDHSETTLDTVIAWYSQVFSTRLNDFKTGRQIIIQQRMHERDLTGHLLENDPGKEWVRLILPMEYETERRCVTVPLPSTRGKSWADPRKEEGELLCPDRIGPKELKSIKAGLASEYVISGQLQQSPSPAAGGIIKKAWFPLWKYPTAPKVEFTILSVDTALSVKKTAAFSAATTWGVFKDEKTGVPNVILLSMWRERVGYPELRERLQRMAECYLDDGPEPMKRTPNVHLRPSIILIENKASGISLIQDLARAGVSARPVNPDRLGDKVARVRLVSHFFEGARVWLPAQGPDFNRPKPWALEFLENAAAFPNASTRDLIDTATQALHFLGSFGWVWHPDDPEPDPPKMPEFLQPGEEAYY